MTPTKLVLKRYLSQLYINWRWCLPALLLPGIGTVFTTYLPPLIIAAALTRFGNSTPTLNAMLPYIWWFAGAWLVGEALWRLAIWSLNRADMRAMRNLYKEAMDELARKDIGFFHNNFAGALTKKAIGYGRNFEPFVDTLAHNVVGNVIGLLFASVILWRYSPYLVLVLVGMLLLIGLIVVPFIRRRKKLVDIREAAGNKMAGYMADVIGNMDAVQAFARHDHEKRRHEANVDEYMQKTLTSWDYHVIRVDSVISPLYVLTNALGLAAAVGLSDDGATMAMIFVVFTYFSRLTFILWEFNRIYRNLENSVSDAAQFTELLLEPPAITEAPHPTPLSVTKGDVAFNGVTFTYDKTNKPLFKGFDLLITAGEKIALVGHSGGGKTTVTKLLLRFKDIDAGEITIDGQNIASARLKDVREAIAYVPQEPIMFHRTIRENIRYGRLSATDAEVVAAAKKANAHEFVLELPEGYDTLVGERGVKLSGGQRQRIAIARAIIKDAPILVLDEATSALDSENEKLIQAALWKLMEGRTAIVIAHRLSTIQKMDRIVVLDRGKISEQGSHAVLLTNKNGIYAQLWSHQSGGFIAED